MLQGVEQILLLLLRTQISDNVIIQDCNGGILTYNNVAYNGNVYLRANTGGTHPHYTVQGSWNPNDHGAD